MEKKCSSIAKSIYNKRKVYPWRKCMGTVEKSAAARKFFNKGEYGGVVTGHDRSLDGYEAFLIKKSKGCARAFKQLTASYKSCRYIVKKVPYGRVPGLTYWMDEELSGDFEKLFVYESRNDPSIEIDLDVFVREEHCRNNQCFHDAEFGCIEPYCKP